MERDLSFLHDPEARAKREKELKEKAAQYLAEKGKSAIQQLETNSANRIKNVIAVMSGKGGVGKSSVTSMLAVSLQRHGYRCGILDADITGPSIPKAFNVSGQIIQVEAGMLPQESKTGIKVLSVNLMVEDPRDPVVWRGPVIANLVRQFWTDSYWDELDFLLVDMPPGTGDVPLTVFQSLPVSLAVAVTSPQDLVSMIVTKAIRMADKMNIETLALVENMSSFSCPDCGKVHNIFGKSHAEEYAKENKIPAFASLPIDPTIASAMDCGAIELVDTSALDSITDAILQKCIK